MRLLPSPLPNSIVGKSILTCLSISFFIITFMKYYQVSHFLNFKFTALTMSLSTPPKKAEINLCIIRRISYFFFSIHKEGSCLTADKWEKNLQEVMTQIFWGTQWIPSVITTMHWTFAMCQAMYWMLCSYDLI